jgi:hypothetical protein
VLSFGKLRSDPKSNLSHSSPTCILATLPPRGQGWGSAPWATDWYPRHNPAGTPGYAANGLADHKGFCSLPNPLHAQSRTLGHELLDYWSGHIDIEIKVGVCLFFYPYSKSPSRSKFRILHVY